MSSEKHYKVNEIIQKVVNISLLFVIIYVVISPDSLKKGENEAKIIIQNIAKAQEKYFYKNGKYYPNLSSTINNEDVINKNLDIDLSKSPIFNYSITKNKDYTYTVKATLKTSDSVIKTIFGINDNICLDNKKDTLCKAKGTPSIDYWIFNYSVKENKPYIFFEYPKKLTNKYYVRDGISYEYLHKRIEKNDLHYLYYIVFFLFTLYLISSFIHIVNSFRRVRYEKLFKNSLILKLEKNLNNLSILTLEDLKNVKLTLSKIGRFEKVLDINSIEEERYGRAVEFFGLTNDKKAEFFAKRVGGEAIIEGSFYKIILPNSFPLKLQNFLLSFYDKEVEFKNEIESKLFLLSCRINQESKFDFDNEVSNYEYSRKRTNGYIIPKREQITSYLLSNTPTKVLIEILSNHISFRDLSPYTTSGGVEKESLFFGRVDMIRNIMNKSYANYLIVGGRQLGKSSLLYALRNRYKKNATVECYYITLNSEDILSEMGNELGVEGKFSLDDMVELISKKEKKVLFLIDEVDKFVKADREDDYKITRVFRKLAQERKASFIMTGFWELYHQVTTDYQSPLKNFGELIRLSGLEEESCREMMSKPMSDLGIGFEDGVIDFVISKCGRRANLIAIICNKVLEDLESRKITREDIDRVLEEGNLDDFLKGWGELSGDIFSNTVDRLIIDVSLERESFRLRDVVGEFKSLEFDMFEDVNIKIDSKKIEDSLSRLEIAYIFKKIKGDYINIVPLFKEKLLEGDMDILLDGDVDRYQQIFKAKEMIRQGKDMEEIIRVSMLEDKSVEKLMEGLS